MKNQFYVYIATNKDNTVLYTGMTNKLERQMFEHKNKLVQGFTKKYNANKLIFFDTFSLAKEVILAEKKIKGWTRNKKELLIKNKNPEFNDLFEILHSCSE